MTVGAMRPNRWNLEPLLIAGPGTMLFVSTFLLALLFGGFASEAPFAAMFVVVFVLAIGAVLLLLMTAARRGVRRP